MLHQLVYVSKAARHFKYEDLTSLLAQSRAFNQYANITGILLYRKSCFLQLLEGEEQEIDDLFNHIQTDGRHYHIKTLLHQPVKDRAFENWSMQFNNLEEFNTSDLPKFSNLLNVKFDPNEIQKYSLEALGLLCYFQAT